MKLETARLFYKPIWKTSWGTLREGDWHPTKNLAEKAVKREGTLPIRVVSDIFVVPIDPTCKHNFIPDTDDDPGKELCSKCFFRKQELADEP